VAVKGLSIHLQTKAKLSGFRREQCKDRLPECQAPKWNGI